MNTTDTQRAAQEMEYSFPYHYIPTIRNGKFSSTRHWDWGFRYLGGIHLALDQLAAIRFESLIDIGCGDGRFLHEVSRRFPDRRLLGIDASQRAILLARAMNQDIDYRVADITRDVPPRQFDAATMIEVIEHIEPGNLPDFIRAAAATLVEGGTMLLTVPHRNKPLIEKHYQHFSGEQLLELLSPHFTGIRLVPFDVLSRRAPLLWIIERFLGAKGRWMIFAQPRILHFFYRQYIKRYLYAASERECERIAVMCTKKPGTA